MGREHNANRIALAALIVTLILAGFTAFGSYRDDTGELKARLSVVEHEQKSTDSRMERIEDKIDRLLERVK